MTETAMPLDLSYGKVIGRFILAVSDGLDADKLPDATPAVGKITISALNTTIKALVPDPTTVVRTIYSFTLDQDGWLVHNGERGVWLIAGSYKVSYDLKGVKLDSHTIEVLPENDDANPLDLFYQLPPGGPALSASEYAELSARFENLEAINALEMEVAAQAAAAPAVAAAQSAQVDAAQSAADAQTALQAQFATQDEGVATLIADEGAGPMTKAALNAAVTEHSTPIYAPRRANLVASIGDSITWRNKLKIYSGASTAASTGWLHWANAASGHRMTEHGNVAVSGKRTDEMLVTQLPAVLALDPAPGWCTVLGGANNIIQGRTSTLTMADLAAIYDGLGSKGIGVIAATITPQTGLTAAQSQEVYRINSWIKQQATLRRDFILVDWHAAMSDAAGLPRAGVLADNVHQSIKGAAIMGRLFADAVRNYLPAVDVLPMPGDFRNAQPNPLKVEAGLGYGPNGAQSADVAYNYRFATADSTTLTATPRIVARTDDIPGNWQAFKIASGNARLTNASIITAVGGQKWQATAELDIDPAVAAAGVVRVSLLLAQSGGSPLMTASFLDGDPDVADGAGATIPVTPGLMVLRTPPVALSAGATGLYAHVRVYGSTGTGEVRVGRQSVMQVP